METVLQQKPARGMERVPAVMQRIVVPCDFSEPAREAYGFARQLVKQHGGSLAVIKVIDFPLLYESTFGVQPYVIDPKMLEDMETDARTRYQKMKEGFGDDPLEEEFHVLNGPVTKTIREFVKEHAMDLIIMGTHGATGLKELFVGSTTEKVVRYSTVPVIAVKKYINTRSIRKIVLPISPDYKMDAFVRRLKELQEFFGATLHIVYIITPNNFRKYTEIRKDIEQWIQYYGIENCTCEIRSDLYEQDGIIEYAREMEADLIAMGTHGRKGVAHLLAGSIAEDVVNHMECPIWTYSLVADKG